MESFECMQDMHFSFEASASIVVEAVAVNFKRRLAAQIRISDARIHSPFFHTWQYSSVKLKRRGPKNGPWCVIIHHNSPL
jgi:hypothetical protein